MPTKATAPAPGGGVQSIERAFRLLETMADHDGILGLSALAAESGLPIPTIHRLVRTLVNLGYVRQEPNRQYALGPRLIRLGESSSRMLSDWAKPHYGVESLRVALYALIPFFVLGVGCNWAAAAAMKRRTAAVTGEPLPVQV